MRTKSNLPSYVRIHGTQYVHKLLVQFHWNGNCNRGSHTENSWSTVRWHVVVLVLYVLLALYKGLIIDWFNSKQVAKACDREYKLFLTNNLTYFCLLCF